MPRMTIEFNDKIEEILKSISNDEQTTKADVIRRALALYDVVHKEVEKGRKVIIKDKDDGGRETEIVVW